MIPYPVFKFYWTRQVSYRLIGGGTVLDYPVYPNYATFLGLLSFVEVYCIFPFPSNEPAYKKLAIGKSSSQPVLNGFYIPNPQHLHRMFLSVFSRGRFWWALSPNYPITPYKKTIIFPPPGI